MKAAAWLPLPWGEGWGEGSETRNLAMTTSISYAVDSDGIATLTIDQPGKSMNVVGPEFCERA